MWRKCHLFGCSSLRVVIAALGPHRWSYRPSPNIKPRYLVAVTHLVAFDSPPPIPLTVGRLALHHPRPPSPVPRPSDAILVVGMAGARRGRVSRSLSPSGLRAPTLMSSFEVSSPAPTEEQNDPFECCSATPLPQVRLLQEPVLGHYRRSVDGP